MNLYLSDDDIKNFVNTYGDGDVYYSHKIDASGKIVVRYFPVLTKFVSEENVKYLIEELNKSPFLIDKYTRKLILTDEYAYVLHDNKTIKNKLTKNYPNFLKKVKHNKSNNYNR